MSKRPHAAINDEPKEYFDKEIRLRKRSRRAEAVLDQGRKELCRALKFSKGFERQKLGRRQKTALAKDENMDIVSRLASEVEALKQLDLSAVAELHLYKSLVKVPAVRNSPALPLYVTSRLDAKSHSDNRTIENVRARLLNANPVKTALEQILTALCDALHLPREAARKKKRIRSADFNTGLDGDESSGPEQDPDLHLDPAPQSSWSGFSSASTTASYDSGINGNVQVSDHGPEHNDVYKNWERHIRSPQKGGTKNESSDIDINGRRLSPVMSSESSAPPSPGRNSPSPFLANGYVSGSSDAESLPFDPPKPRKNRRGQQERRAIWEKKFGKNANHSRRQGCSRDHGWDAKKGALGSPRKTNNPGRKQVHRNPPAQSRTGDTRQTSRAKPAERKDSRQTVSGAPLHPSWEAAKRAKEKRGSHILPFQGQKLVFD